MMKNDKLVFIDDLCNNCRISIKEQVDLMPEDWDGHELRQFIADWFAEQSYTLSQNKRRLRDYKNAVATMGRR